MGDRQAAMAFYNQGISALQAREQDPKMVPHAYQLFSSATMADPLWWQSHYQCGNNASDLKLMRAAIACWRRALECDPPPDKRGEVLCNLGWRLHCVGATHEAFEITSEAVKLNPNLSKAWLNLSLIHGVLNQPMVGAECARRAYALAPDDPENEFALGFALLYNRDLVEGFRHFEARFRYRLKEYLQYPYPKWDGAPDKTVYLVADQGLGDTLSFARFVRKLCARAKYVHARVQPQLMRLFTHAFVDICNLNLIPTSYPFPAADAWTTFVSLPSALGLTDAEIRNEPQIDGGQWSVSDSWLVPDRKLHVGIAWAGSPLNDIDRHRNIPVEQFFELYRVPGVQLYSLQVGEKAGELHTAGGAALVRDVTPYVSDVVDTLALLRKLDLVISVESALPHICALAGHECWVPYSYLGRDYRIGLDDRDMLWTPRHRIFPQGPQMNWDVAFDDIAFALKERLDELARKDRTKAPRVGSASKTLA